MMVITRQGVLTLNCHCGDRPWVWLFLFFATGRTILINQSIIPPLDPTVVPHSLNTKVSYCGKGNNSNVILHWGWRYRLTSLSAKNPANDSKRAKPVGKDVPDKPKQTSFAFDALRIHQAILSKYIGIFPAESQLHKQLVLKI